MKNPILIGAIAVFCVISALLFWRAGVSRTALRNGPLSAKVDALTADWNANNVPPESRKVTFVISDTEMDDMVGKLYAKDASGGGAAEVSLAGDTLPTGGEPSVFGKMLDWTQRTFFRGGMTAPKQTAFAESFVGTPGALTWSHSGFAEVSEEEMARELMKAILKANDAGAEINIVTYGVSAVAAYKAINSLKDVVRNNKVVEINRLVSVEMNKATLKKLDPEYFKNFGGLKNVREWLNIWTTSSRIQPVTIELFAPTVNGIRFPGRDLFPMLGITGEITAKDLTRLVKELTKTTVALEKLLGYWSQVAKAKADARAKAVAEARRKTVEYKHLASRDLMGRAYTKDEPVKAAPQPLDSLSAINGGWLKEENEKAEKEAEKQKINQTRTSNRQEQPVDRCEEGHCNWNEAVEYCKKKGLRLPTANELKNTNRTECSGGRWSIATCRKQYWTSEEYSKTEAWYVGFNDPENGWTNGSYGHCGKDFFANSPLCLR